MQYGCYAKYVSYAKWPNIIIIYSANNSSVISAMGCAQGCADSQRCTQSDAVRSQAQNLLLRLCQKFNVLFSKFFQNFVIQQNLTTVMEFFHALCGFCMDSTSLLSPMAMPSKNYSLSCPRILSHLIKHIFCRSKN